ncbi:MAG: hypothetical protein RIT27_2019 [Pseudomonadota bacterium]
MLNMGLKRLVLVRPQTLFPCAEATARASGADEILVNAQHFNSLKEAVEDCTLVIGTTARERSVRWEVFNPEQCAKKIRETSGEIAIVFGREHSGLTNEELDLCHAAVKIPTNPDFSSLNLAAAVQVIAYEIYKNSLTPETVISSLRFPAPTKELELFYAHLEQTLVEIGLHNPEKPRRTMRKLRSLFNRAQPDSSEVALLRGILTETQKFSKLK